MSFEFKNALRDLDERTPTFFLGEIFAHGDQTVRLNAVEILRDLDSKQKSSRVLREILKLV